VFSVLITSSLTRLEHGAEELEGFALVFLFRILLRISRRRWMPWPQGGPAAARCSRNVASQDLQGHVSVRNWRNEACAFSGILVRVVFLRALDDAAPAASRPCNSGLLLQPGLERQLQPQLGRRARPSRPPMSHCLL